MDQTAKLPLVDPRRRVFIPVEKRNVQGLFTFRTLDGERYVRKPDGSIRRASPKVNGKAAKKARRCQRS